MPEEIKEEPKPAEPVVPAPEPEVTPDKLKEENVALRAEKKRLMDEHSSLGRKVKTIESELSSKYENIYNKLNEMENRGSKPVEPKESDEPVDISDLISDPAKLDAHIKKLANRESERIRQEEKRSNDESNRKRTEQSKAYETALYGELFELMKEDPDKDAIENELLSQKFIPSADAKMDAERFYLKAQSNVYKKLLPADKQNKFKKNDDMKLTGTGVGGGTVPATKTVAMPKLSPEAEKYLKRIGKSDDPAWVLDALESKAK